MRRERPRSELRVPADAPARRPSRPTATAYNRASGAETPEPHEPRAPTILGYDASPDTYERIEEQVYTGRNLIAVDRADGSLQWETQIGTAAQVWPYLAVGDTHLYAKYREPSDEDTSPQSQWYVVEKSSGEIRGSFGSDVESEVYRTFGVADGALYEHVETGVRVWE